MRVIVIGAVHSSRVTVERLCHAGVIPKGIVTLPLDLNKRHSDFVDLRPIAEENRIPVFECKNSNNACFVEWITKQEPDYVFVVGWSQILSGKLLHDESFRVVGYHPSPLPRDRGRAVIPWTILLERRETAGTLFFIDEGVDTGPILDQLGFVLADDEDAGSLYQKHCDALAKMLDRTIPALRNTKPSGRPQNHTQATYCAKRTDEDGEINWNLPAERAARLVRATSRPYPGAFSSYRGSRVRIWRAEVISHHPYIGLPGQIQSVDPDGLFIMCGDGAVLKIKELENDTGETVPFSYFKIHGKFKPKQI